jgi:hypothetical protein
LKNYGVSDAEVPLQVEGSIMPCLNPLTIRDNLDLDLEGAVALWNQLRRAENNMPFSDDLKFSDLSRLSAKPFVLSVFASPERFRFEFLHKNLQGAATAGRFVDEMPPEKYFSYLRAQSSATLEAAEPTFLRISEDFGRSFGRVLLPMWGNGQINMLFGAISS